MTKSTTFLEVLQKNKEIDVRDNRGKRLDLPLILLEFILALLCNRDGNLSSLHRHMVAHHGQVVQFLGLEKIPKKQ